jgi:Putative Actinobacterial Holin-X, holin superfamily III
VNGASTDARPEPSAAEPTPPIGRLVVELRELIVEYFKQETVVPLQQLRRYVVFGLLGALLLGFGAIFLGLAGLRALQTETDTAMTGNWSWAPYAIVMVVLLIAGYITWRARGAIRRRKDDR